MTFNASRTHFPPLALHFLFFKKNHPPAVNLRRGCTLGQVPTLEGCTSRGPRCRPQRCTECAHKKRGGSDDQRMSGYFYIFYNAPLLWLVWEPFFFKSRQWRPLRNKK